MYAIEKGIEMPEGRNRKYPFKEMEVGDSFFVDEGRKDSLQAMCSQYGKKYGRKFCALAWQTGVRVWRAA